MYYDVTNVGVEKYPYSSGRLNESEENKLNMLVMQKFPKEFHYSWGEDEDGKPLQGKALEKWEELDVSDDWDWNTPYLQIGSLDCDYCQAHMKQFIAMIEESETYAELQAKWKAFYKQVPKDKIIHICT